MARTKQSGRKRPVRKHKRLNDFIKAYDKLCKTDIEPRAQCIALKSTMAHVKSSYEEMIKAYRYQIDKEKNRVIEPPSSDSPSSDSDDEKADHQAEVRKYRRDHDSDGDAGDGGAGGTGKAGFATFAGNLDI